MNPTSYTFQGVTVSYSDQQKALVLADQNNIQSLQDQIRNLQEQIGAVNLNIATYAAAVSNNPHGSCYTQNIAGGWRVDQACVDANNAAWNQEAGHRDTLQAQIDTINNSLLPAASKKLNDDIITIQNDIKLQIQTQLANTAQNTAAAAAANLPNQSNLSSQQQIALINAQSASQLAKQQQQTKIAEFIIVAFVVIGLAALILKKG